jgi:hypothetical protein
MVPLWPCQASFGRPTRIPRRVCPAAVEGCSSVWYSRTPHCREFFILDSQRPHAGHLRLRQVGQTPAFTGWAIRNPYVVITLGDKAFRLQMGHKVMTVSIDSLKPYLGMGSLQAMDPPLQGSPPAARSSASIAMVQTDPSFGVWVDPDCLLLTTTWGKCILVIPWSPRLRGPC